MVYNDLVAPSGWGRDDTRVVVTIGVVGGTLPGTRTFGCCEGNLA